MKHKIFIIIHKAASRVLPDCFIGNALADDGDVIAGHCSSTLSFAYHDMGLHSSDWQHDLYNAHFGEGNWELELVDTNAPSAAFLEAFEVNRAKVKLQEFLGTYNWHQAIAKLQEGLDVAH